MRQHQTLQFLRFLLISAFVLFSVPASADLSTATLDGSFQNNTGPDENGAGGTVFFDFKEGDPIGGIAEPGCEPGTVVNHRNQTRFIEDCRFDLSLHTSTTGLENRLSGSSVEIPYQRDGDRIWGSYTVDFLVPSGTTSQVCPVDLTVPFPQPPGSALVDVKRITISNAFTGTIIKEEAGVATEVLVVLFDDANGDGAPDTPVELPNGEVVDQFTFVALWENKGTVGSPQWEVCKVPVDFDDDGVVDFLANAAGFIDPGDSINIRNDVTPDRLSVGPIAGVTVTFEDVQSPGSVRIVPVSDDGDRDFPSLTSGFQIASDPPVFFDITSTADWTGDVTLRVTYKDDNDDGVVDDTVPTIQVGDLKALHEELKIGGDTWVDRTVQVDTTAKEVSATVSTFSGFVLGAGPAPLPDSDLDGVDDDLDICPGFDDSIDSDSDSVPDGCDLCPLDAANDADGDGICGDLDVCLGDDASGDSDADGLCDDSDPCIGSSNSDVDNDGICDEGDLCFGDDATGNTDGDGVCDDLDACDGDDATGDTDGDQFCDDIDICPVDPFNDADSDGLCAGDDNCPNVANANQNNADGDDVGDACDGDDDNDGVPDEEDNCQFDANPGQEDGDGDGAGDVCDDDSDNDGVANADDQCPGTATGDVIDALGCSVAQLCPCENSWKNHGAYVRCVAHAAEDFVSAGLLTEAEKDATVSAGAESTCGHKNN